MNNFSRLIIGLTTLTIVACAENQQSNLSFTSSVITKGVNSATIEVNVTGDNNITDRGIIYSDEVDPSINDYDGYVIKSGSGEGTFTVDLTSLEDNGYYYFKPFAVVSGKLYYGEEYLLNTDCPGMGQGPAGGYVFYSDGSGGGLEAAPYDIEIDQYKDEFPWGCSGLNIYGTSDTLGSGPLNTDLIIANCSDTNAAAYRCDNYEFNDYDDWYLPSYDELVMLYQNVKANNYGKFINAVYYSSTQNTYTSAKCLSFSTGNEVMSDKGILRYVRPIRTF